MDIKEFRRELFIVAYDLQKLLRDAVAPICLRYGLTLQQMHVLVELAGVPGQTLSQLSARSGILRTNFSGVCRKLEEQGLVERRRSEYDRRAFVLHVTDEGSAVLARIDADVRQRYSEVFDGEPQETFDTILAGFKALSSFAEKLER